MKIATVMSSWTGALATARVVTAVVIVEAVALVAMAVALNRVDRTVVMIAPEDGRQLSVSRQSADASYLEVWAYSLANLFGNVTPQNVGFVKERVAPLLCPDVYEQTMQTLSAQADTIRQDRTAISFLPDHVLSDPAAGRFYVEGMSVSHPVMGGENRFPRTFEFQLSVRGYRVVVCSLDSYQGSARLHQSPAGDAAAPRAQPKGTSG